MSGIPGYELAGTNLFNFGPELDAINVNVQNILANQNQFFATVEKQQAQLAGSINNQIAALNTTIANLATLLQATILASGQAATVENQNTQIALLTQIKESLTKPVTVGLDPTETATTPQLAPTKPGP